MLVDHLGDLDDGAGRSICLYVYFQDEDESKPTLEFMFAKILEQLIQQLNPHDDASRPLQRFLQQYQSHSAPQTTEEYLHILAKESEAFFRVYLVLDGLDTHWDPRSPQFQERFVKAARQLTNWNLLLTSRIGIFTEGRLDADYKLVIHADATAKDIELYLNMRISESTGMSRLIAEGVEKDSQFKNQVLDTIVKKAQGMFVLAEMHMDSLDSQPLLGDLKKMLHNLPESRETTFEEALRRIRAREPQFPGMALHTLSWVAFSLQPVTVDMVSYAFALRKHAGSLNTDYRPSEQQLIESCAGIVVADSRTGLLRSAHEAVMRYVRGSGFLPDNAHQDIARQCLAYLSFEDFSNVSTSGDIPNNSNVYPLLEYAAKHWFNHFHKAERSGDLEKLALHFLQHAASLSLVTQIRLPSMPRGASGLHECASLGEGDLAKKLLKRGMSVQSITKEQQTPLHWAVQFGHIAIAQLFLDQNAPVDAQENQGNTALHLAVRGRRGGEEMVRLLIKAGARMDIRNTKGFTPLRWCLKYGLRDKAIPLIEHQAEVDVEDSNGHTPLRLALWYGQLELIELMVLNGCNVNKQGSEDGWSALHHAAQFGYEPLTSLLLDNKAEVELRDKDGLTPLRWAIMHSHLSTAKLLLDSGADVNAPSNDKSTPLIQATIQATTQAATQATKLKNEQAVWLLLSHKSKMDKQDSHGNTALHYAARYGNKSILWLLLEEGASLDIQNINGRTPLHEVVAIGNLPMAWYLIVKGAKVSLADAQGCEPVHLAARQGCEPRIFDMLRDHGADFNQKDRRGLTPLHYAAYMGHESIVQKLLDCGAQAALQDGEGLTALHHAVRNDDPVDGHHVTILKLGKTGSCLDQQDNNGRTPLMYAAIRGDSMAILCLNGANKDIRDAQNRTAKDHAVEGQHSDVIHRL